MNGIDEVIDCQQISEAIRETPDPRRFQVDLDVAEARELGREAGVGHVWFSGRGSVAVEGVSLTGEPGSRIGLDGGEADRAVRGKRRVVRIDDHAAEVKTLQVE